MPHHLTQPLINLTSTYIIQSMSKNTKLIDNSPKIKNYQDRLHSYSRVNHQKKLIGQSKIYKRLRCSLHINKLQKDLFKKPMFLINEQSDAIQVDLEHNFNRQKQEKQVEQIQQHQNCKNEEDKNIGSQLHDKNEIYLQKMRNGKKMIIDSGISLFTQQKNPNTKNFGEDEHKGLHRFTNIVIKRLQNRSNKVSFSQFVEIKKQKDFSSKFKFIFPKRSSFSQQSKLAVAKKLQLANNKATQRGIKHYKSAVLQNEKKIFSQSKIKDHVGTRQRYKSICGLSDMAGISSSLQISKIHLNQSENYNF